MDTHETKIKTAPKKVSVIIPSFNSKGTVGQAIDSVLAQTFKDLEIIIIDDGSTDNTQDFLRDYIDRGDIHFIVRVNGGPGAARNTGIEVAQGTYVAFLDADDWWPVDKLEKQVNLMESAPELMFSYTDAWIVDQEGNNMSKKTLQTKTGKFFGGNLLHKLVFKNVLAFSSTGMIRKDILEKVGMFDSDRKLFFFEDYDLVLTLAPMGPFGFIDEPLMFYRTHPVILQDTIIKNYKNLIFLFKKHLKISSWKYKIWYFAGLIFIYTKYLYHRTRKMF